MASTRGGCPLRTPRRKRRTASSVSTIRLSGQETGAATAEPCLHSGLAQHAHPAAGA
jgi:hypothetical protein